MTRDQVSTYHGRPARACSAVICLVVVAMLALCMNAAEPAKAQVEEIHLAIRATAPPVPAMRYHFMPDLVDQVPGNAALLYLAAAQQMASTRGEPENNPPGTDDEK